MEPHEAEFELRLLLQDFRREMAEIEHFLKQDWRFKGFVQGLECVDPGQERDDWYANFIKGVYRSRHSKDAKIMIDQRAYQACVYITLYDEDCADAKGLSDEYKELCRDWKSSFFDPVRGGWVQTSHVPYNLGQCGAPLVRATSKRVAALLFVPRLGLD
jgi:hypothetical protein